MSQVFSQQMFGRENKLMDGAVLDLSNPKARVIWPAIPGTSTGITVPSFMVATPPPAIGSAIISLTFAPQPPHSFLMGPTIGPSQAPTFRQIALSDLPAISGMFQPLNPTLTSLSALANAPGMLKNSGFGTFSWGALNPYDVGLGNVENTTLSTWPGSTNLITLGTITTGIWAGTSIGPTHGGTGLSSYVLGDTIYASAANVLSPLAGNITSTRNFLRQTGTGLVSAAPAWDTLLITDLITPNAYGWLHNDGAGALTWSSPTASAHDILSATHGDTLADTVVLGDLMAGNATPKWARVAGNTTIVRQFLRQTGNGAISAIPAWDTVTNTDVGLSSVTNNAQALAGAIGSSLLTMNTARMLGRSTAGVGAIEEIILGTNLSFTGTTLNASGGSTSFANPTASVSNSVVNGSATTAMRSDAAPAISTSAVLRFAGLTVDTSTLSVDSTNHRVGIGSITPAVDLDITAGASGNVWSRLTRSGSTKDASYIIQTAGAVTVASPQWNVGVPNGASNFSIYSWDGASIIGRLGIDTSGIVRIPNTTSSTTTGTGSLIISGGLGVAERVVALGLTVDTSTLYVDSTNHRVGVLTASPGTNFSVGPNASGNTWIAITRTASTNDAALQIQTTGSITGSAPQWNFGTPNGAHTFAIYTWDGSTITTRMTIGTSGLVNITNATDATTTATGALTVAGGLGVAKTIYAAGLQITGGLPISTLATQANNTILGNISGGAAAPSALTGSNVRTICGLATTDSPTFVALTTSAVAAVTTAAEAWVGPSSTTGVYFKGGNVGIGTTSPLAKLDLHGPSGVTSFTGNTRLGVFVGGSTALNDYSGLDFDGTYYGVGVTKARIAVLTTASGSYLKLGTSNDYGAGITNTAITIDYNGSTAFGGSITTGAPIGGTAAAWKLGVRVAAASVLDAAHYVQLDIGGVLYKLALIS